LEQSAVIPYFQLLRLLAAAAAEVQSSVQQLLQQMAVPVAVDVLAQAEQVTPRQYHQVKGTMGEADHLLALMLVAAVVAAHLLLAVPVLVQLQEMAVTVRHRLFLAHP